MKEKFESLLTRIKDLEAEERFLETEGRMLTGRCG